MVVRELPPLAVLLTHLGACAEAVKWCGRRTISKETLDSCPNKDWSNWITDRLRVNPGDPWSKIERRIWAVLDGDGAGYGYGYGYGYGDGYGYGAGYGYGYGYGDGDGAGDGAQPE